MRKRGGDTREFTTRIDMDIYEQVGNDRKMGWYEYVKYIFLPDWDYFLFIAVFGTVLPGAFLFCLYVIFWFPQATHLYFDRDRQVVYSWFKGRVTGCHFDHLCTIEFFRGTYLILRGEDSADKKVYIGYFHVVHPGNRPFAFGPEDNDNLYAVILAFMEQGKEAVITGDKFKRRLKPWELFLRYHPKPDNFDERLETLLSSGEDEFVEFLEDYAERHC